MGACLFNLSSLKKTKYLLQFISISAREILRHLLPNFNNLDFRRSNQRRAKVISYFFGFEVESFGQVFSFSFSFRNQITRVGVRIEFLVEFKMLAQGKDAEFSPASPPFRLARQTVSSSDQQH